MSSWPSWNSLCRPGWFRTQRSTCSSLPRRKACTPTPASAVYFWRTWSYWRATLAVSLSRSSCLSPSARIAIMHWLFMSMLGSWTQPSCVSSTYLIHWAISQALLTQVLAQKNRKNLEIPANQHCFLQQHSLASKHSSAQAKAVYYDAHSGKALYVTIDK